MILLALLQVSLIALIPTETNGEFGLFDFLDHHRSYSGRALGVDLDASSDVTHDGSASDVSPTLDVEVGPIKKERKKDDGFTSGVQASEEGWVDVESKIDLREVFERLNKIPRILQALRNMTSKIETFDKELILAAILPAISGVKSSVGTELGNIKLIMKQLFQDLKNGQVDANDKSLLKILELLEGHQGKPVQCELGGFERDLQKFGVIVERKVSDIQQQITAEIGVEDQELKIVRHNAEVLTEVRDLVKEMNGHSQAFGSQQCELCKSLEVIANEEREVLSLVKTAIKAIYNLPQGITSVITSEGGLGGIRREIQALLKSNENVEASIANLSYMVKELAKKSETYFKKHAVTIIEASLRMKNSAAAIETTSKQTLKAVDRFSEEAARAARSARNCQ